MTQPVDDATDHAAASPAPAPAAPTPARGPRTTPLGWLFIVLAIADLAWLVRSAQTAGASVVDLGLFGLSLVPSVAAVLIAGVFLLRHPDAPFRARTLLFGTILFAAVEALQVMSGGLQSFFERATPASAELPSLVPLSAAYSGLTGIVGSFGLVYIAVGLARERRYEDRSWPLVRLITPVAAALAAASGLLAIARVPSQIAITPAVGIFLASQLILSVVTVLAWAYLVVTTLRGFLAGEVPRPGWLLASFAGALVLGAIALAAAGTAIGLQDATWAPIVRALALVGYSLGHVFLLLAFVVGLPSLADDDLDPDAEAVGL